MAFRYGAEKAQTVVQETHAEIARREREFLVSMLEYAEHREGDPTFETMTLDELRAEYGERYDEIWLDGTLTDDNARHEADDYFEGFSAGAALVVRLIFAAWPEVEERIRKKVTT